MRILVIVVPKQTNVGLLKLEQVVEPYYQFRNSSAEIVFASPNGGEPIPIGSGQNSMDLVLRLRKDRLAWEALTDTLSLDQVFAEDFDAAYCLGDQAVQVSS